MSDLKFDGSIWCNIDIALRNVETIYKVELEGLNLSVIEWYVLRVLYEEDGQMASQIAAAVGRAATSFTPILDKLQNKDFIERRSHPKDRRAICVYLTQKSRVVEEQAEAIAERVEIKLRQQLKDKDMKGYEVVIADLQTIK